MFVSYPQTSGTKIKSVSEFVNDGGNIVASVPRIKLQVELSGHTSSCFFSSYIFICPSRVIFLRPLDIRNGPTSESFFCRKNFKIYL